MWLWALERISSETVNNYDELMFAIFLYYFCWYFRYFVNWYNMTFNLETFGGDNTALHATPHLKY